MKQSLSRTKIIATLGPAASTKDVIIRMIKEGVDVFRINFSHSTKEEFLKLSEIVKELNLPPVKIHCSVLAEDAIKAAIEDYRKKNNITSA